MTLINKLRAAVDQHQQEPRAGAVNGNVRFFVVGGGGNKAQIEQRARERMAVVTSDVEWTSAASVKTLILEHRMAANRLGFLELFAALYEADSLRTGLLDGTLAGLQVFVRQVLPLLRCSQGGDRFGMTAIVRKYSPLLSVEALRGVGPKQPEQVQRAREATDKLVGLFSGGAKPTFGDVLLCIHETDLLEVPDALRPLALRLAAEKNGAVPADPQSDDDYGDPVLDAWDQFLRVPFAQIEPYAEYVAGRAPFDTHQGIKGREFPRVLVIIDDQDSRGFLFSYEKLFGAKAKSQTDIDNEKEGKETTLDRTRRLFYVTCSRAMSSLGIIAYTSDPNAVKGFVLTQGWFSKDEIEDLS